MNPEVDPPLPAASLLVLKISRGTAPGVTTSASHHGVWLRARVRRAPHEADQVETNPIK